MSTNRASCVPTGVTAATPTVSTSAPKKAVTLLHSTLKRPRRELDCVKGILAPPLRRLALDCGVRFMDNTPLDSYYEQSTIKLVGGPDGEARPFTSQETPNAMMVSDSAGAMVAAQVRCSCRCHAAGRGGRRLSLWTGSAGRNIHARLARSEWKGCRQMVAHTPAEFTGEKQIHLTQPSGRALRECVWAARAATVASST